MRGSPLACTKPMRDWMDYCRAFCKDMEAGVVVSNVPVARDQEPLVERPFNVATQEVSNPISLAVVASGANLVAEISRHFQP